MAPQSDAFVFFGATGDLAYRQIFPALQSLIRRGVLSMPIIGVASSALNLDGLRARARESLQDHGDVDAHAFAVFSAQLRYINDDYRDADTFVRLREALGPASGPLYYLAIPPDLFPTVVEGLAKSGCNRGARVIVEKPFGRDLVSAQALNRTVHGCFPESAIFRIDHYLGKEPVQNLVYFRFANAFLALAPRMPGGEDEGRSRLLRYSADAFFQFRLDSTLLGIGPPSCVKSAPGRGCECCRGRLHNVSTSREQLRENERQYEHERETHKTLLMNDL